MPPLIYLGDFKCQPDEALCIIRSFKCIPHGRRRKEAVHHWLKGTLAARLKLPEDEIDFARTHMGKPWLPKNSWLNFNLSHSGSLAVIALSARGAVGVDIEKVSGSSEVKQRIAARFFHRDEVAWLSQWTDDYLLHFTTIWSLKEAWLKMSGVGLTQSLSSFCVIPGKGSKANVYGREGQPLGVMGYRLLQGDEPYCLAYAIDEDNNNPPVRWRVIEQ